MAHAIQVIDHWCNRFAVTEFKGAFASGIRYCGVQSKLNIGNLVNPGSINTNESSKSLLQDWLARSVWPSVHRWKALHKSTLLPSISHSASQNAAVNHGSRSLRTMDQTPNRCTTCVKNNYATACADSNPSTMKQEISLTSLVSLLIHTSKQLQLESSGRWVTNSRVQKSKRREGMGRGANAPYG